MSCEGVWLAALVEVCAFALCHMGKVLFSRLRQRFVFFYPDVAKKSVSANFVLSSVAKVEMLKCDWLVCW